MLIYEVYVSRMNAMEKYYMDIQCNCMSVLYIEVCMYIRPVFFLCFFFLPLSSRSTLHSALPFLLSRLSRWKVVTREFMLCLLLPRLLLFLFLCLSAFSLFLSSFLSSFLCTCFPIKRVASTNNS